MYVMPYLPLRDTQYGTYPTFAQMQTRSINEEARRGTLDSTQHGARDSGLPPALRAVCTVCPLIIISSTVVIL